MVRAENISKNEQKSLWLSLSLLQCVEPRSLLPLPLLWCVEPRSLTLFLLTPPDPSFQGSDFILPICKDKFCLHF